MTLKEKEPRPPKTLIKSSATASAPASASATVFTAHYLRTRQTKTGSTQATRSLSEIFYQARAVRAFQMPLAPFGAR